MEISKLSHNKLVQLATSAKNSIARAKERSAEISERATATVVPVVVGTGWGWLKGRYAGLLEKRIPGTNFEIAPAFASGALIYGILGFAGKSSDTLSYVAAGVVGAEGTLRGYAAGLEAARKAAGLTK